MAEGGGTLNAGEDEYINWDDQEENLVEQKDEVMALESIYSDTENLRVMSRPEQDVKRLFHIEIDVEVRLKKDGILVQTWIPYESETQSPVNLAPRMAPGLRPDFKRTESGKRWHSTFLVSHLKPITLSIRLPQSYPSDCPPDFNLSALWLDAGQLSVLCQKLDQVWKESLGMPIIYSWVDYLQNETLSVLCIESSVTLTPFEDDGVEYDPRALPECQDLETDLLNLILYAEQRQQEEFVKEEHECGICFMEYPGRQFHRLEGCKHHFCQECLSEYCLMHVTEGTVQQLRCPERECKNHMPPGCLRDVLGEEAYIRWERLCLQKALETMEDITWCPRCNSAVISDTDGHQAYCINCGYSFCPRCYESFHGRSACASADEQMTKLKEEIKKVSASLGMDEEDLENLETENDGQLAHKAINKMALIRRLQTDYLSKQFIKKETKKCPGCKVPIEKYGGCNKVTCYQCGKHMCWLCQKAINGYEHFHTGHCALFPGPDNDGAHNYLRNRERPAGANAVQEAIEAGGVVHLMKCPQCGSRNLRNGRNNHLKCWACKSNLCFQCKGLVQGLVNAHFSATKPCKQHSAL